MTNFLEGDPRIFINADGASLEFKGGQPVLDRGLENQVLISLFSDEWFGNIFFRDPAKKLNSHFENANRKPITLSNLKDIENAAAKDLEPMIEAGSASQIEVETVNTVQNGVQTSIAIAPKGSDLFTLVATKHGENWIAQASDPAHRRG